MRIAFIAWGSVVWNPRDLSYHETWVPSKLELPVEFSRKSMDGRLTLVVDFDAGTRLPMYVARSTRTEMQDAIADLRDREQTIHARIGWFVKSTGDKSSARQHDSKLDHAAHDYVVPLVKTWLDTTDYDAAVWTALSANYEKRLGTRFSVAKAVDHLLGLTGTERRLAYDYISRAPDLIQTSLRKQWNGHSGTKAV